MRTSSRARNESRPLEPRQWETDPVVSKLVQSLSFGRIGRWSLVLSVSAALALFCSTATAQPLTVPASFNFTGCAAEGTTTSSNSTGFALSTVRPGTSSANPGGCAYWTSDFENPGDGSQDRVHFPEITAQNLDRLEISFTTYATVTAQQDYFLEIESSSSYCAGRPTPCEVIAIPQNNTWQSYTWDISNHAGAADVQINFHATEYNGQGDDFGFDSVSVTGSALGQDIAIVSPTSGTVVNALPVNIEVVFTANALDTLTASVELWEREVGTISASTSTTGNFAINNLLVSGKNVIRVVMRDGTGTVIDEDQIDVFYLKPHGDVNDDTFINFLDVNALIGIILGEEDLVVAGDLNLDGVNDILDVILLIGIALDCLSSSEEILSESALATVIGGPPSQGTAQMATDGLIDNNIVVTAAGVPGEIQIDLGARYRIDRVVIWNRTDGSMQSLSDLTVTVRDGPSDVYAHSGINPSTPGPPSGAASWDIDILPDVDPRDPDVTYPQIGDIVVISKDGSYQGLGFGVKEIQIFGGPAVDSCNLLLDYILVYNFNDGPAGSVASTISGGIADTGSEGLNATASAPLVFALGEDGADAPTNRSLSFDGNNEVELSFADRDRSDPIPSYLDLAANESFSIDVIVNTTATSGAIVSNDSGPALDDPGFQLVLNAGRPEFIIVDVLGNRTSVIAQTNISGGGWYRVTAVRDTGEDELRIYVDGGEPEVETDTSEAGINNTSAVRIGRTNQDTLGFVGKLDLVIMAPFVIDPLNAFVALPFFWSADDDPGFRAENLETAGEPVDWVIAPRGSGATNNVIRDTDYYVCSGGPCLGDGDSVPSGAISYYGDDTWTDYGASVSAVSPDSSGIFGILARLKDGDNFYGLLLDNLNNEVRLVAKINGIDETLDSVSFTSPFTANNWVNMTIEVVGNNLTGYVDGVPLVSASDGRLASGDIGFYTYKLQPTGAAWNQLVAFDGLRVIPAGDMTLPYSDGFGSDPGYVVVDSRANVAVPSAWVSVNGEFVQSRGTATSNVWNYGTIATFGNKSWTSVSVEVDVYADDDEEVGIIARYIDPDNFYRFSIRSNGTRARIDRIQDGTWTNLKDVATSSIQGGWHTLKFVIDGTQLSAYRDDVLIPGISVTDQSALYHGGFGFYTNAMSTAPTRFDNVDVQATACGDGACSGGETSLTCPQDCASCGDGVCSAGYETRVDCPDDCNACGDGFCDWPHENVGGCDDCCSNVSQCTVGTTQCYVATECTVDNHCVYANVPAGQQGNGCTDQDADACTTDFECDGGGNCVNHVNTSCSDDQFECGRTAECDPNVTDGCIYTNIASGTACDDGSWCTINDECDGLGLGGCFGDQRCGDNPAFCNRGCLDDPGTANSLQTCASAATTACDTASGGPGDGLDCTYNEFCDGGVPGNWTIAGECDVATTHTCTSSTAAGGTTPRCESRCDTTNWTLPAGNSCGTRLALTPVDDLNGGIGDLIRVTGNCENMGVNDHWYRVLLRDDLTMDRNNHRDYFAPHIYFQRNDDDLFQFDVWTNGNSNGSICGSLGSLGCNIRNHTYSGSCDNLTEYRADLRQNPCQQASEDRGLENLCTDDDTYYWIRVQTNGGDCNGCAGYSLAITNGVQCTSPEYADTTCPSGWACDVDTSSPAPGPGPSGTHPRRCVRSNSSGDHAIARGNLSDGLPTANTAPWTRDGNCDDISNGGHWYSFTAHDNQSQDNAQNRDNWAVDIDFNQNDSNRFRFQTFCQLSNGSLPGSGTGPVGTTKCTTLSGNPPFVTSYTRTPQEDTNASFQPAQPDWYCANNGLEHFSGPRGPYFQHCLDNKILYWVKVTLAAGQSCDACYEYQISFENDRK